MCVVHVCEGVFVFASHIYNFYKYMWFGGEGWERLMILLILAATSTVAATSVVWYLVDKDELTVLYTVNKNLYIIPNK